MLNFKTLILAAAFITPAPALAADAITGNWITEDKDAVVRIQKCGSTICGKIAKYLVTPPNGTGQKDVNNPNKKLRSRTLLGSAVLTGFKPDGDVWRGKIYDPKSGKTYRSVVQTTSSDKLKVEGCISIFCQGQNWTRAR